jgi:hypothetical protein
MDSIIQFAEKILKMRNVSMALASIKAMERIIRDRAFVDPAYYIELNNLLFRMRMLLAPLEKERARVEFETGFQLKK